MPGPPTLKGAVVYEHCANRRAGRTQRFHGSRERGRLRARNCCRATSPPPIPSAASAAAISPGRPRSRLYSVSTSGHSCSSTSVAGGLGRGGQLARPGSARRTRPGRGEACGSGPRKRSSVPVIAAGHDRRARLEREPPGPAVRRAELLGVADARALGEQRQQPALAQDLARGLERLGVGLPAAHREGAEAHEQPAVASLDQLGLGHEAHVAPGADADEERVPEALVVGRDDRRARRRARARRRSTRSRNQSRNSGTTSPRTSA